MDLQGIGRLIAIAGLVLVLAGLALWLAGRIGLGPLPGDIRIANGNWGCFVPLGTMLLLSLLLTIVLNIVLRLFNR
ncbi:MAG TPA: DUF2905 family protein [Coriobacteriia bacterium]|nr:DUF2905 family protein [Coriobacteriia bacterium]